MWPDLAKYRHFGETFKVLDKFSRVYLPFGKILNLLWQILYTFWKIFIDVNDQMLKNNLAIWSHCSRIVIFDKILSLIWSWKFHRQSLKFPSRPPKSIFNQFLKN